MGPEYEAPGKVPSKANTKMDKKGGLPTWGSHRLQGVCMTLASIVAGTVGRGLNKG